MQWSPSSPSRTRNSLTTHSKTNSRVRTTDPRPREATFSEATTATAAIVGTTPTRPTPESSLLTKRTITTGRIPTKTNKISTNTTRDPTKETTNPSSNTKVTINPMEDGNSMTEVTRGISTTTTAPIKDKVIINLRCKAKDSKVATPRGTVGMEETETGIEVIEVTTEEETEVIEGTEGTEEIIEEVTEEVI